MTKPKWQLKIMDGIVCRAAGTRRGQTFFRTWWLGKRNFSPPVIIHTLPKEYWGKRIQIKIEIMGSKEEKDQQISKDI